MRIVCIGDSITAGQYLPDGDQAWPLILRRALPDDTEVLGRGVSNDTTRMMLERFPADVQSRAPDIVVIQAGHNDANRWETDRWLPRVSLPAFSANLQEMIARCRAFSATPVLCNLTPTAKDPEYEVDARSYSDEIQTVAALLDVQLVDVRGMFLKSTGRLMLDDGLHPSPEGHAVYARAVQTSLLPLAVAA